jgi:hypothetical protein
MTDYLISSLRILLYQLYVEGVRKHHGAKVSPYYMLFDAIHIVAIVHNINISTASCRR